MDNDEKIFLGILIILIILSLLFIFLRLDCTDECCVDERFYKDKQCATGYCINACWETLSTGTGAEYVNYSDENGFGRIYEGDKLGNIGRFYQDVNISPGIISFDIKIIKQDFVSGVCSLFAFPGGIIVDYVDTNGDPQNWYYGYYINGTIEYDCAEKVNQGVWTHKEIDLTTLSPMPDTITKISLFSGGWELDTYYDNVVIGGLNG